MRLGGERQAASITVSVSIETSTLGLTGALHLKPHWPLRRVSTVPKRMSLLLRLRPAAAGEIDRVLGRVLHLDPRQVHPGAVLDGQPVVAGIRTGMRRGDAGAERADIDVLGALELDALGVAGAVEGADPEPRRLAHHHAAVDVLEAERVDAHVGDAADLQKAVPLLVVGRGLLGGLHLDLADAHPVPEADEAVGDGHPRAEPHPEHVDLGTVAHLDARRLAWSAATSKTVSARLCVRPPASRCGALPSSTTTSP